MRINHNIAALNTYRQLNSASTAQGKSMEKLSSGLRINKAGDDAAGLAISEKMRGQIRGLDMASKNSQDGISLLQTAEGALNETHDILQRMRELAVQAGNDTNTTDDRGEIQKEINQLTSEINRIANTTEFNTKKVLDGGKSAAAAGVTTGGTGTTGSATAPKLEGSDISALIGTDIAGTDITVNGQSVALTNVDALDATADMDGLVAALQSDIDAVYDGTANSGVTFTVGKTDDGKGLTITSSETGTSAAVEITANADSATLGLTTDASTDASVNGEDAPAAGGSTGGATSGTFTATLQIGANKGQAFQIDIADMSSAALGISQASSTSGTTGGTGTTGSATAPKLEGSDISALIGTDIAGTDITVNGQSVALTNVDALDATADMDGLVAALQSDIDAVYDGTANSGVTFTVGKTDDGKGLTITSSETGTSAAVEITANADSATLGLTTDASTDASVNGEEAPAAGGSTGATGSFTGTAGVSNGTDNNSIESALDVSTHANATNAIEVLDGAIKKVSQERSKLGAYQNRLEHTINNLNTSSENLTAAESRVRDVDYALAA